MTHPLETSSDRLRYVADMITTRPGAWDMAAYVDGKRSVAWTPVKDEAFSVALDLVGVVQKDGINLRDYLDEDEDGTCGTTACVAGWGCLVTSYEQFEDLIGTDNIDDLIANHDWSVMGQIALGLTEALANAIFYYLDMKDEVLMAKVLNMLADLPEEERTLAKACEHGIIDLLYSGLWEKFQATTSEEDAALIKYEASTIGSMYISWRQASEGVEDAERFVDYISLLPREDTPLSLGGTTHFKYSLGYHRG